MLFILNHFCMKLIQCHACVVSTVGTDGQHQDISSHSAEYQAMYFQLFMGQGSSHADVGDMLG